MALFGGARDISLFRHVNRELMGDIITQQCAFYKYKIEETKVNLYGEAAEEKYYMGPVLLNCLIDRKDQEYPETDLGTDFNWGATFKFLRDDLLTAGEDFNKNFAPTDHNYGASLVPEVGDIILYQDGYYEVDNIISISWVKTQIILTNPETGTQIWKILVVIFQLSVKHIMFRQIE